MNQNEKLICVAATPVLLGGPLLLALAGLVRSRRATAHAVPVRALPWNWNLTTSSALLYTLAFNLTFLTQEFFLVLPKALTPGLQPTLFHNNHTWRGENPLAELFQGTGALATFLSGITCAVLVLRRPAAGRTRRLFLIWMAYTGFFQSLPQVIIGAVNPANDVGVAMDYLRFGAATKTVAALLAIAAIPVLGLWLTRPLLSLADDPGEIGDPAARTRFVFRIATLPALTAILLIIPFRIPRDWVEVALVPIVATLISIAWPQAGAWRVSDVEAHGKPRIASIAFPLAAVLVLLLVFQLLLRPGVQFY